MSAPPSYLLFLGTYTRNSRSQGIYAVRMEKGTGEMSRAELVAEAVDPAWITLTPDGKRLYSIHASTRQAIGFDVDATTGALEPIAMPDAGPANPPSHLAIDATGRTLLAANYREGFVAAIPIRADGTLGPTQLTKHEGKGLHPTRQEKPHVHSVTVSPDNRFVIVADLGVDKIFSYALDAAHARLTPATPPFVATSPGAGPRHFKFGRDGRHAYAINELNSTIVVYDYEPATGRLSPRQTITTLPPGSIRENTTAEIRVHPNGKFVYGSNRGDDSIAVFSVGADGTLSPLQIEPTRGKTPRNFALSPDGRWLVVGHQDTPLLSLFYVEDDGRLSIAPYTATVPACVCVLFHS